MAQEALGMVETRGLTAAIEAADAMSELLRQQLRVEAQQHPDLESL